MALEQFAQLTALGLWQPAASVYCARPRFAKPFGGRDACFQAVHGALLDAADPAEPEPVRTVVVPAQWCDERVGRCEAVVGGMK